MIQSDQRILSVAALTRSIKGHLEAAFPFTWVRGQVTNLSRPSSGHIYFTLKDQEASLSAVWFKQQHTRKGGFDPLTGEVYEDGQAPNMAQTLENGQEIICAGRLTVYEARGQYQMIVELAENVGIGRLQEEFKKLQARLEGLGFFKQERKRPLPPYPKNIAVVTSPQGAAIHDFLRIAENRGFGAKIRIYPAQVQGIGAEATLARYVEQINLESWADVIVLIRGGGSLEDLWCFNTELLASAVFNSRVPVLAGIGHEIDFTLTDLTADVRAATPSHAAQLLFPERAAFASRLGRAKELLDLSIRRKISTARQMVLHHQNALHWQSPKRRLEHSKERLGSLSIWLEKMVKEAVLSRRARLDSLQGGLQVIKQRLPEKRMHVQSLQKQILYLGDQLVPPKKQYLLRIAEKLSLVHNNLREASFRHGQLHLRLESANPLAPLDKGYAMVTDTDGLIVKSVQQAPVGKEFHITFRDGSVPVTVTGEPDV